MKIRLPPNIKALIEESAKKNNRTLNAEINWRLEATFAENTPPNDYQNHEAIRQIIREELSKLIEKKTSN